MSKAKKTRASGLSFFRRVIMLFDMLTDPIFFHPPHQILKSVNHFSAVFA
jgi:hypothetical protein